MAFANVCMVNNDSQVKTLKIQLLLIYLYCSFDDLSGFQMFFSFI